MGNQLYCRCNDCCDSCRTLCNLRGRGPLYVHKTDDVGAFLKAFPTCPLAFPLITVCHTNGIGRTHQHFCLLHLKVDALNHIADSLLLSTTSLLSFTPLLSTSLAEWIHHKLTQTARLTLLVGN